MPLTPDDAIERNKGKKNLQFERAIQDLAAEVEKALAYYTGNPVYVGLPAYLQYKRKRTMPCMPVRSPWKPWIAPLKSDSTRRDGRCQS